MDQNLSVWIATVRGRQYVRFRLGDKKERHLGPIEQVKRLVDKLNALGINGAGIPITLDDIRLAARAKEIMTTAEKTVKEIEAKKKEVEEMMKEVEEKRKEAEAMMKEVEAKKKEAERMMRRAREMMKKAEEAMKQAQQLQETCSRDGGVAEDVERLQKGLDVLKHSLRFSELENRVGVIRAIVSAARLGDDSAISRMFNFIAFLDGILEYCKEDVCKGFKKYLSNLFRYRGEGYDVFEELYDGIREDLRYALERVKKQIADVEARV